MTWDDVPGEDVEVLRVGDWVRVIECACHESVQPRHTRQEGELCQCQDGPERGTLILFPVLCDDGSTCYAGEVDLVAE